MCLAAKVPAKTGTNEVTMTIVDVTHGAPTERDVYGNLML